MEIDPGPANDIQSHQQSQQIGETKFKDTKDGSYGMWCETLESRIHKEGDISDELEKDKPFKNDVNIWLSSKKLSNLFYKIDYTNGMPFYQPYLNIKIWQKHKNETILNIHTHGSRYIQNSWLIIR